MEGELTCRGPRGCNPPHADENLRIVWHEIIGNFTFLNTLMILIGQLQYDDRIHTHSWHSTCNL